MHITVLFSPAPRKLLQVALRMPAGARVADALRDSGVLAGLDDTALDALQTGIWGRRVPASQPLRDGDRVEAYRALRVDPKVARRERFVRQGAKKAAGLFSTRRAGAKAGY